MKFFCKNFVFFFPRISFLSSSRLEKKHLERYNCLLYLLPFLLSLLSGVAMSSTFPPYDRGVFACIPFVAFIPVCSGLLLSPLPKSFLKRLGFTFFLGFLTGAIFFLFTLEWITCVAWEGLATLPFYLALYAGLWGAFVGIVLRPFLDHGKPSTIKNLLIACLSAAAWSALEWLRGTLFTGFGWNCFGVAFHHTIPLLQICDVTGVLGLSFLGVMTSCSLTLGAKRFIEERKQKTITLPLRLRLPSEILIICFLILTLMIYGIHEMLSPIPSQRTLSIVAIQGNIPQNHKWDHFFEESIMATYCRQSQAALALHPDLIVWPEAATPRPLLSDAKTFFQVQELLAQSTTDFLIGSLYFEKEPPRDYNAAILLNAKPLPGISEIQYYAKTHLLPFGEYIPCRQTFPIFKWLIGERILGDFNPGPGPKLLSLSHQGIRVAPLLCFEDTLGDLTRNFAILGAQGLITLTNDGWFGHSAASSQHLINALFRCAETKLPMLRVANTGVTCLIDRFGRITHELKESNGNTFFEGMMASPWKLPKNPSLTFYSRYGDLFAKGCLGITLGSIMIFLFIQLSVRGSGITTTKSIKHETPPQ